MKTCPFCAEEIQDAAIKCKHCGEFLEGASPAARPPAAPASTPAVEARVERAPKAPPKQDIPQDVSGLVCGFCRNPNVPFRPIPDGSAECPRCQRQTVYSIRKVRTKKSRQQSQHSQIVSREISIRIYGPNGEEDLLEFMTAGGDIEAKSGDWLAFTIVQGNPVGIVNLTVGNRLDLAFPLQAEIAALEKQIASLRPAPPPSPQSQGCCMGCFFSFLGFICFGSADPAVGSIVGSGAVILGVLSAALAPAVIKTPPPTAADQAKLDQIVPIQAKIDELKRYQTGA